MAEYSEIAKVALWVGTYALSVVVALLCVGVYRWFRPRSPSLDDQTDDLVELCVVWPLALTLGCVVGVFTFISWVGKRFIDKCNSAGMRRLQSKSDNEAQDDE